MQRIETALHFLQDEDFLNLHRHRFSVSPPPYESPPITEPPSPVPLLAQPPTYTEDEILHQPFSDEELHRLRSHFHGYDVDNLYTQEAREEQDRIEIAYYTRDEEHRRTWSGLDLEGRAGGQRCRIMIRNCIRKRWERLGLWNPTWGIPNSVKTQKNDEKRDWRWEWEGPLSEKRSYKWPSVDLETGGERAIRRFIQEKGRWNEQSTTTQADDELDIDPRELFLVNRPWFQFRLEAAEEAQRLKRVQRFDTVETAAVNTRTRWKHDKRWQDAWCYVPGWKWQHESPSPEPEDPNNLDFSPSEIDALDAVPPPTPQKPYDDTAFPSVSIFGSRPEQREDTIATRDVDESHDIANLHNNTGESGQARQPSTKRKRQNESSQYEGNASPVSKRAKSERIYNRQSASPRSSTGTLWVDTKPSANGSRRGDRSVKVRRSARLVPRNGSDTSTRISSRSGKTGARTDEAQKKRPKKRLKKRRD